MTNVCNMKSLTKQLHIDINVSPSAFDFHVPSSDPSIQRQKTRR